MLIQSTFPEAPSPPDGTWASGVVDGAPWGGDYIFHFFPLHSQGGKVWTLDSVWHQLNSFSKLSCWLFSSLGQLTDTSLNMLLHSGKVIGFPGEQVTGWREMEMLPSKRWSQIKGSFCEVVGVSCSLLLVHQLSGHGEAGGHQRNSRVLVTKEWQVRKCLDL